MYYSETQFYTLVKDLGNKVYLQNLEGTTIEVPKTYLAILNSHERFNKEEKITQTDMIKFIKENPRIMMSVSFRKVNKEKGVRAFKAEKEAKIKEIQHATLTTAAKLIEEVIENPISKIIPGEIRIMKGFYLGTVDDRGRLQFKDMEEKNSAVIKTVDTRTTFELILNDIKYTLKK